MLRRLGIILIGAILPFGVVQAELPVNYMTHFNDASGADKLQVLQSAMFKTLSTAKNIEIIKASATASPEQACEIAVTAFRVWPSFVEEFTEATIASVPTSAGDIVACLIQIRPEYGTIIASAAIAAGADPTDVTAATAAGLASQFTGPRSGPVSGVGRPRGGTGGGNPASPS